MSTRTPSSWRKRLLHRAASTAMGSLARRRRWPGTGAHDTHPPASARRLLVPAHRRPDASVLVITPDRGEVARMPVVYLLHGWPDAPEAPLAAGLARAVTGGGNGTTLWPPFVLVVPDGTGWRRGDHEWADAADGGDLVESWLVDAVVPAVEAGAERPRSQRTLAGFSMGGYGALNVGLHYPGVFGSLVSFAGYFHADDPEGVFAGSAELMLANSPAVRSVDAPIPADRHPRVALVESDHEPSLIQGQAAGMAELLRAGGIDVLEAHVHGRHSWRSVASSWPGVLTWLSTGWNPSS